MLRENKYKDGTKIKIIKDKGLINENTDKRITITNANRRSILKILIEFFFPKIITNVRLFTNSSAS